jgi:hypothetical protein
LQRRAEPHTDSRQLPHHRTGLGRAIDPDIEQAAERLGGNRACLALARKLLKRSYHTLRELGDEALAPA